jgi:hypothetical protein
MDPQELARRYEDLRAAVPAGSGAGWRHGWGVLACSGMAAWLHLVAAVPAPPARPAAPRQIVPSSPAVATELVHALAAMALAHA